MYRKIVVFIVLSVLSFLLTMNAQIPRTISYQGILTDTNGNYIPDGNHSLRLTIYDDSTNGTPVYSETQTVAVVKGLFSVSIGSVTPIPSSLTFDKVLYLSMSVDNGSELSPRTALTSVPYSLHSEIADVAKTLSPAAPNVVTRVNGMSGVITLQGTGSTSVTQNGSVIEISSTGGGGTGIQGVQNTDGTIAIQNPSGPTTTIGVADNSISTSKISGSGAQSGQVLSYDGSKVTWITQSGGGSGVTSLNNATGVLTLAGANGATVNTNGNTITITAAGGGGTGVQGVQSSDGTIAVTNSSGPTVNVSLADGSVTPSKVNKTGASSGQVLMYNGANVVWGNASGGSGFTLPYSGQANSSAQPAFKIINTAAQSALYGESSTGIGVTGVSTSTAGVFGSSSGNGSAVMGMNTGVGRAGYFAINNASNAAPALEVNTNGTGDGIVGHSISHNGVAGLSTAPVDNGVYGGNDNGGNGVMGRCIGLGNAIIGFNGGTGRAGFFQIGNVASTANALESITAGTGRAGYFQIDNSSNHNNALEATTNGASSDAIRGFASLGCGVVGVSEANTSNGVYGINDAGGDAVHGRCNSGAGIGVHALVTGTGRAGLFQILNSSNNSDVLTATTNGNGDGISANISGGNGNGVYSWTSGTGDAGYFEVANPANTKNALEAWTSGTGYALSLNHNGTSGSIAVFKSSGANKARIDKTGKGFFNGGTQNSGADVAEAFEVEGDRSDYEPGDVLTLSLNGNRKVTKSSQAYSELVAGIVATKPGVLLTEHDVDDNMDQTVPMGIAGVIPTKVCTENGAIKIGDLLVTSSTKGCAMKADRSKVSIGNALGKAMEDFDKNEVAKINVLVNIK